MTNNLQVFSNPEGNMAARTISDDKGNIWFVAKDVAQALDYGLDGGTGKYFAHVPEQWKGGKRISTPNGEQEMLCLTEQGLYFFLGRSDKPKALPYQMWIAGDVVPSIRQHGFYATPATAQSILDDPDNFIQVLQAYKEQKARNTELEAKVPENKPAAIRLKTGLYPYMSNRLNGTKTVLRVNAANC